MRQKHHMELINDVKTAADKLHADTSVDQATTRDSLKECREHIDSLIETIEESEDSDDN